MKRCYALSREWLKFLAAQERVELTRDYSLTWERIHSIGTARAAAILSAKRGLTVEPAHAAGALHDLGRIVTGKNEGHPLRGSESAKEFLAQMNIFNDREIEEIAVAIKNHGRKDLVGGPLEEVIKDSDVLDSFLLGIPPRSEAHRRRLAALKEEMGIRDPLFGVR